MLTRRYRARFCLNLVALARAVAEDREHYHHHQRHKDNDDRDLHAEEQETNQRDQLLEQSDHQQD